MIKHLIAQCKFNLIIQIPSETTIKVEKAGYKLFETDLIIEVGESRTLLVEMEKGVRNKLNIMS